MITKTKELFQCEICRRESENRDTIERCELGHLLPKTKHDDFEVVYSSSGCNQHPLGIAVTMADDSIGWFNFQRVRPREKAID